MSRKYETMLLITVEGDEISVDAISKQPDEMTLPNAIAAIVRDSLPVIVSSARALLNPPAQNAEIVEPSPQLKLVNAQGTGLVGD